MQSLRLFQPLSSLIVVIMVFSIMVPHFADIGSGGMPPMPTTILMSGCHKLTMLSKNDLLGHFLPPFQKFHSSTISVPNRYYIGHQELNGTTQDQLETTRAYEG
jgi:hypothetical protein